MSEAVARAEVIIVLLRVYPAPIIVQVLEQILASSSYLSTPYIFTSDRKQDTAFE